MVSTILKVVISTDEDGQQYRLLGAVYHGQQVKTLFRRTPFLLTGASFLLASGLSSAQKESGFKQWTESSFQDAQIRVIAEYEIYPTGRPVLPYTLDTTILYLRGTPWTEARALRHIRRTAAIFEPCGINLGTVQLGRLYLPKADRRLDTSLPDPATGVPDTADRLAALLPTDAVYPVAFLIGRVDGTRSMAISYRPRTDQHTQAAFLNTAWIGYQAHWFPRKDDQYSPLAHELAHLLCRCGHSDTEQHHLLHSARNFLSSDVLPEHCQRFQGSPFVSLSQ